MNHESCKLACMDWRFAISMLCDVFSRRKLSISSSSLCSELFSNSFSVLRWWHWASARDNLSWVDKKSCQDKHSKNIIQHIFNWLTSNQDGGWSCVQTTIAQRWRWFLWAYLSEKSKVQVSSCKSSKECSFELKFSFKSVTWSWYNFQHSLIIRPYTDLSQCIDRLLVFGDRCKQFLLFLSERSQFPFVSLSIAL